MSDAPTYRCPECDTYSGTFTSTWNMDECEVTHSTCGRSGSPDSFTRGTPEYDAVYDHQEGDEDEEQSETAATALNLAHLSVQAWADLAPHLSCSEAEVVKSFLRAWADPYTAQVFIDAHAAADDDESDLHYQGGS
jgi:hypothetical protein